MYQIKRKLIYLCLIIFLFSFIFSFSAYASTPKFSFSKLKNIDEYEVNAGEEIKLLFEVKNNDPEKIDEIAWFRFLQVW